MKCYILAGGKSRRFGEDKLLYRIRGERVIERVLRAAKTVFGEVYVVCKEPEKFSFLGVPTLKDELKDRASIVGLYTALKHSQEKAFILSGDLPLLGREVIEYLLSKAGPPITLAREGGKLHTLVGVYWPDVLPLLEEFIEKGNYRITEFVKKAGFRAVEVPGKYRKQLLNLNRKEDLSRILAIENLS
ncbi:MAG: molybdenum cofactor guanylyltransferase MobA [Aquificae bacterium]|nr:molybdenum cofactor guanylyltransferase MobA [Aquificota bacterium]